VNTISYAASSHLRESLQKIDVLRKNILLAILTPERELRFRWQATVERVFWSLSFLETPLDKNEIVKLFKKPREKQTKPIEQKALDCKKGFDYLTQEWIGSQEPVSPKTVIYLHGITCEGRLRVSQESLRSCLLYFQNTSEHPVIQASLIYSQIVSLSPFTKDNDKIASLLAYLFLYKAGFYCRGFLVLEEYFKRNLIDHQQILRQTEQADTQTLWIEFFAKAVENTLEKVSENISANKTRLEVPTSMFKLNERQKEILALLENPEATITNRQIQKLFKTSAITASRDLAKLTTLELLFIHGKGRSVYYTKI
jgi:hypothetical protein